MLKSNLLGLNQGRVLREFSPEEVTSNLYTMVDVLLHQIQIELQRGHIAQVVFYILLPRLFNSGLYFVSYFLCFLFLLFNLTQDLLSKVIANLAFFIWTHELLPLDILLLALIDRDDDPYALRIVV